jgi:hypothetical protein
MRREFNNHERDSKFLLSFVEVSEKKISHLVDLGVEGKIILKSKVTD